MVATAAIVALLFLSSNVTAAAVKNSRVDKAPFKGTPYDFGGVDVAGCGTTVAIPNTPDFNLTNGNSSFNASVSVRACADLYSSDTSDAYGGVGYNGSKWTQAATASETVTFVYNLSYTASASAKPSKGATASASSEIFVESVVYDGTNGSEVSSGFVSALLISESSGAKTVHKVDQTFKVADGPTKYVKGDFYYVEVFLELSVYTSVESTGSGTASAALTLEPTGHQTKLVSVSIA